MTIAQEQLIETLRRRFHAIIDGEDAEFNARAGLLAVDDLERLLDDGRQDERDYHDTVEAFLEGAR